MAGLGGILLGALSWDLAGIPASSVLVLLLAPVLGGLLVTDQEGDGGVESG